MAAPTNRHPYAYTLDLLRLAIDRLPPTFSAEKKEQYRKRLGHFLKHPEAAYGEIQETIASLGRDSWPFRKAYEDFYARYGRASEESFLLENLDLGIREKYEQFIHEGGKINHIENAKSGEDIRRVSPFERYFTPEEKFAIEQALLAARDAARQEIDDLVLKQKRDEYEKLVAAYAVRQGRIQSGLDELRKLAGVSPRWEPTIRDQVRTFEEGWSVVERGVDEPRLDKELEYWRGTLEAFLQTAG